MTQRNEADSDTDKAQSMEQLTLGETFPEVSETAIAAVAESKADDAAEQAQEAETENVKRNKDGSIAKKRGRKAGQTNAQSTFYNPNVKPETKQAPETPASQSFPSAVVVSGVLERLQMAFISDEFEYTETERNINIGAWSATFDYYGGVNLSPPAILALSHAEIIMTRATKSKTQTRFALIKAWFADKFAKIRGKKNALSDSGENVKRENNLRNEESGSA